MPPPISISAAVGFVDARRSRTAECLLTNYNPQARCLAERYVSYAETRSNQPLYKSMITQKTAMLPAFIRRNLRTGYSAIEKMNSLKIVLQRLRDGQWLKLPEGDVEFCRISPIDVLNDGEVKSDTTGKPTAQFLLLQSIIEAQTIWYISMNCPVAPQSYLSLGINENTKIKLSAAIQKIETYKQQCLMREFPVRSTELVSWDRG